MTALCYFTVLSKPQLNHNSTQRNITLSWLDVKMTHPPETQCQQYLSCYRPDFDETLNDGSWVHLEQIQTVMVTFAQTRFVLETFVHIRNLSAVTDPIFMKP